MMTWRGRRADDSRGEPGAQLRAARVRRGFASAFPSRGAFAGAFRARVGEIHISGLTYLPSVRQAPSPSSTLTGTAAIAAWSSKRVLTPMRWSGFVPGASQEITQPHERQRANRSPAARSENSSSAPRGAVIDTDERG